MYLPKLSNQKTGCYHSKSPTKQTAADHSSGSTPKPEPAQVNDIGQELAELKASHDYLSQTLYHLGEQLLGLA